MDNLFAQAYLLITGPLQGAVNNTIGLAIAYIHAPMLAGIAFWIAVQGGLTANGLDSIRSLYRTMLRAALIVSILQSAVTYNFYVGGLAQTIPVEITAALSGTPTAKIASGAAFDTLAGQAIKAGLIVFEHAPKYSISGGIMMLAAVVYLIFVVSVIAASFLVYLLSVVTLLLGLAVGPIFVALFCWPQTARYASGWVSLIATSIVVQILSVVLLGLISGSSAITVAAVIARADDGNVVRELLALLGQAVFLGFVSKIITHLPAMASSIAGGAAQRVNDLTAAAFAPANALKTVAGGVAGAGARAAGGAAIAGAQRVASVARPTSSAGRSLSGGP